MRQLIFLLALPCLLFSCKKQEKLLPNNRLALVTPGSCDVQGFSKYAPSGYSYYKIYLPNGRVDSLYMAYYGPYEFAGKAKYDSHHVYLVQYPTDTIFSAELNNLHQVVKTTFHNQFYDNNSPCYFTYNGAGKLTRFTRDTSTTDDCSLYYDSLGNVSHVIANVNQSLILAYTYDYSTPIGASDYLVENHYSIWVDLQICQRLNLIDINPRYKVTRAVGPHLYPEYDRTFTDQVIDANGNVTSYYTSDYYGWGNYLFTSDIHCF